MIFYNEIFRNIYKEQRWSHATLAKRTGLSRQSINKWALGQVVPSEKNIRKIARVLKVPVSEISSYKNDIPVSELEIANAVDSVLSYSEATTDELHKDYTDLVAVATRQYKNMEQTSLITKAILNSLPAISYIKDVNSKYVTASKQFIDALGLQSNFNVLGKVDEDFFGKDVAEKNYKEDLGVILTGDPVTEREDYIFGSRRRKWGLISKTPVYENEKIVAVLGVIMDITAKKKQEKALQFLLSNISKLHDKKMFYGIADKDKKLIYADRKAYEEVLGIPSTLPKEKIDDYWLNNIVHPDDRKEQSSYTSNNFVDTPLIREYRIIHPRKGLRWINTTTSIYMGNIMSFSEDITEDKTNPTELER